MDLPGLLFAQPLPQIGAENKKFVDADDDAGALTEQ